MSTWSGRSLAILHSLIGISERLLSEHELPHLYNQIVQIALAELPAGRAALMLWDEEGDRLSIAAVAGLPLAEPDAGSLSLEGRVAEWVATHCESLLLDSNASTFPELGDLGRAAGLRSVVGVPVIGQGRILGVLAAGRQDGTALFTPVDRDLLTLLAGQVAISLENARLRALIARDISERQQAVQQLAQTEKLAGMGRLAASIAHEINNPLHAIHNSLHLLLNRPLTDEKRARYLGMAQEEVERLIALVQRVLNFYQPARDGMRPIAVHPILEHVLRTATEQFQRSGIALEREWSEGLPRVMGISSHLKQVFHNLTLNALEAMPKGGWLRVRTRVVEGSFGGARRAVLVEFTDNGPGIPDSAIQTIFEPFYTTKSHGTGLGLALSYNIVEQHSGMLSVRSEGERTTFRVTLPALNDSPAPAEQPPPLAAAHHVEQ
jgi:signal transduction histidine kinase